MLIKVKRKIHEQMENFNKEIKTMKNYQTEIMELKNAIIELKNLLEGFNN